MSELILLLYLLAALCIWDWLKTARLVHEGWSRHWLMCNDLVSALFGDMDVDKHSYNLLYLDSSVSQDGFRLRLYMPRARHRGSVYSRPILTISKSGPVAYVHVRDDYDTPDICQDAFRVCAAEDAVGQIENRVRRHLTRLH